MISPTIRQPLSVVGICFLMLPWLSKIVMN
ncbi:Uncharacterised protein [Vibrio cholerae]|nr:Uncharacterised protein [Vibrio cholerae]CSI59197.1 Uncharacterised protein [Vibrio cholerae]CSI88133.1 Uncharacterised protein [Vibrio cholerae]